jgi:hypothetical protein
LVDRFLSFCPFSFGHCAVCPSIYGFWLPLWYLKTLIDIDDVLFLGKNPQKYTTKKQINSGQGHRISFIYLVLYKRQLKEPLFNV